MVVWWCWSFFHLLFFYIFVEPLKIQLCPLVYIYFDLVFLMSTQIDYSFCQKLSMNEFQQYWCFDDFLEDFAFWIAFHLVFVVIWSIWHFEVPQITLVFLSFLLDLTWLWNHPLLRNKVTCFFANLRKETLLLVFEFHFYKT